METIFAYQEMVKHNLIERFKELVLMVNNYGFVEPHRVLTEKQVLDMSGNRFTDKETTMIKEIFNIL